MDENNKLQTNMQTSNIDTEGNVLFLDEDRLNRKEVGFPPYKNKPNGLGIYNFILEHFLYMRKNLWPLALKLYHFFIKYSAWMKKGGLKSKIYKRGIMIAPVMEAHTSTIVMPLDIDITDKSEKVVIPMDMLKESLKHASYIAGMDSCLCRDATDCKDYPKNVACLFLGEGGKTVVKHKLGRQFTYEEACNRIDEAAASGLMAQAVWIEVEQMLWGIRNDHMDKFLEVCFCCPCCCIAMRLARNAEPEDRIRFHPSGWTAVPNQTKCIGCRKCAAGPHGCPVEAISFNTDGLVQINQELCVGCGICKTRCPEDVISIKQTMPMRADLHDYFAKDYNLDIKIWDNH